LARGRYVAHLAHDDFWFPWHISGLVATLEETGADWVHPLVIGFDATKVIYCFGPPQNGVPYAEHHVPPSGWMYRRQVFEEIGGWADHRAIAWQIDFDYMRRAALAGKRFALHQRPTVLKFPSPLFRGAYQTGEPAPIQREIFARMERDPLALEREVLLDLAELLARIDAGGGKGVFQRVPSRPTVWELLWWTPRRRFLSWYGIERWPMPQLLYGGFQRRRLAKRGKRGLEHDMPATSAGSPVSLPAVDGVSLFGKSRASRAKDNASNRPSREERRGERLRQREAWSEERRARIQTEQARKKAELAREIAAVKGAGPAEEGG
jgi:hypothetical protein